MTQKLEEARKLYQTANADQKYVLESLFPELKESEDEKIRKHLISLVKNWDKCGIASKYTSDPNVIKQILAWLEKQGEQKPTDKIEQKPIESGCNECKQKQDVSIQINPSEYINDLGGNGCYLKNAAQEPAWSEEDEREVAVLEAYIRSKDWSDSHIDRALGIVDGLVKKLKSLRPQSQ